MNTINPMAKMPGFEVMQAQQEAFMKAMTGNMPTPWNGMGKTDQRPASAKGDDAESLDANQTTTRRVAGKTLQAEVTALGPRLNG